MDYNFLYRGAAARRFFLQLSVQDTCLFDSDPLTHCLCNVSSTSMKARFRLKKLQRQKQTVRSREMKYQEEEQEEEEKEGFGGGSGKLSWALVLR